MVVVLDHPAGSLAVLYVEDEDTDILFMERAFKRAGLSNALHTVGNGGQAIAYLEGKNGFGDRQQNPLPSVILLDLNLPLVSGFDVLKWIRARPEFQTLPVVVFSSSRLPEDKAKASQLGANEFIEKPNSGLNFVDVVQRVASKWLK